MTLRRARSRHQFALSLAGKGTKRIEREGLLFACCRDDLVGTIDVEAFWSTFLSIRPAAREGLVVEDNHRTLRPVVRSNLFRGDRRESPASSVGNQNVAVIG
jgi:hypothetical protein